MATAELGYVERKAASGENETARETSPRHTEPARGRVGDPPHPRESRQSAGSTPGAGDLRVLTLVCP